MTDQKPDLSKVRLKVLTHFPFPNELKAEADSPGDYFPPKDLFEADLSDVIDRHQATGLSLTEIRRSPRHWAEYLQKRMEHGEK
jgi:hypothetical protein